jgi:hypothetical protein
VTDSMAESVADFLLFEGNLKAKVIICNTSNLIGPTVCYNQHNFILYNII